MYELCKLTLNNELLRPESLTLRKKSVPFLK